MTLTYDMSFKRGFRLIDTIEISGEFGMGMEFKDNYLYIPLYEGGLSMYKFDNDSVILKDTWSSGEIDIRGTPCVNENYIFTRGYGRVFAFKRDGDSLNLCDCKTFDPYWTSDICYDGTYVYITTDDNMFAYLFSGETLYYKASTNSCNWLTDEEYRACYTDGNYIYAYSLDSGLKAYSFDGTTFNLIDYDTSIQVTYSNLISKMISGDGNYIYVLSEVSGMIAYEFDGSSLSEISNNNIIMTSEKYESNRYMYETSICLDEVNGNIHTGLGLLSSDYKNYIKTYKFSSNEFTQLESNSNISDGGYIIGICGSGGHIFVLNFTFASPILDLNVFKYNYDLFTLDESDMCISDLSITNATTTGYQTSTFTIFGHPSTSSLLINDIVEISLNDSIVFQGHINNISKTLEGTKISTYGLSKDLWTPILVVGDKGILPG